MSRARTLIAEHRPPGAPPHESEALGAIAQRWRGELARALPECGADAVALRPKDVTELAVAMTELAEDLHADNGLWRELEAANRTLFGTPLPLVWRTGDPTLTPFDARRFRFFLHGVWRHFKPDLIVSAGHRGFKAVAGRAAEFFARAFAGLPRVSSVAAFLGTANTRGWMVKRKLIWLGTHGFLCRWAYADYLARNEPADGDIIGPTDDFLCQHCTVWTGRGALDLLAAVLALTETERAELRGWHERHAAFYRVDALHARGAEIETMTAVNLINDRPYTIRLELPRARCPFAPRQMVFGSLVPWRSEWYWSGAQRSYARVPRDFAATRRTMIEKNARIVFRYRPDLAERARQVATEQHADFVRFHGSDLAVFADGLAAAAAEQRRLREQLAAGAGTDLPGVLAKHGLDRTGPKFSWPAELVECRRGVAVFYHEGEGVEIMSDFDVLRSALGRSGATLTADEAEVLQGFVESAEISPAFVRRVRREHGDAGLAALYYLPTGDLTEVEFLLRRCKGAYYRRRHPDISFTGVE